jgi:hypothetical protein
VEDFMLTWDTEDEWNKFLLEVQTRTLLSERFVENWEELHQILALAVSAQELKDIEERGEATGKVIKNVLEYLPGVKMFSDGLSLAGKAKDAYDASKLGRNASDDQAEDNQLLGMFHIDDGYKELVDNKLEGEFIKWFPGWLEGKSGSIDTEADNVNAVFEEFLKSRGDFDETVSGGESAAKFTDIEYPDDDEGFKKSLKKAGSSLKGIFKGLF